MTEVTYQIQAHGKSYSLTKDAPTGGAPGSVYSTGGRLDADLSRGLPYEHRFLEEVKSLGLSGVALDIGAHVGNHTLWFAQVCGLFVEAFEPDERAYQTLRKNISINELWGSVCPHNVALGEQMGYADWNPDVRGAVLPILAPGNDATKVIYMRPLDTFEFTNVSLVKIDVEGTEPQVLLGAINTLKKCRPIIYAEAISKGARTRIGEVLEPLGYELTHVVKVSSPLGCWRHTQ